MVSNKNKKRINRFNSLDTTCGGCFFLYYVFTAPLVILIVTSRFIESETTIMSNVKVSPNSRRI